jgi:hypothetical protein
MADYLRVVEYLRDVRTAPITSVSDELRQYAIEYAQLCEQANERLRRCSVFLAKGLRSEALQLASEPPALLDLVATLDLPDPQVWADLCQQFDLPVPPPLQMDRAAQLGEAYAQDQSLEDLLNKHRQLALSHAPVRKRLQVMRQIAGMDITSTFWDRDIRAFEHARIKEMRVECAAAIRAKDAAGISDLAAEIEQNQWLEPLPQDLAQAVNTAFQGMLKVEVEGNLQGLLSQLREAYAARNYEQCSSLLKQVREMLDAAGQTAVSTPIANELQPVVQWVKAEDQQRAEQEAFEAACRSFASLLRTDAPTSQIESGYRKLQDAQRDIPPDLVEQYRQALAKRARAVRRKTIKRVALIGTAVLVVLAAAWALLQYKAAHDWAGRIRAALNEGDAARARAYVDEQERTASGLSIFPELATAKRDVRELEQRHAGDVAALGELLAGVAALEDEVVAMPSSAGAQELLGAAGRLAQAVARLERAGGLAWVDRDEKVKKSIPRLTEVRKGLLNRAAERLRADLADLAALVDQVPTASDPDKALASLDEIAAKVRAVQSVESADAQLRQEAAAVLARVDQRRQLVDKSRQMTAAVASLRGGTYSADSLKAALDDFCSRFGDSPLVGAFRQAVARLPLAKSVEAWQGMVSSWGSLVPPGAAAAGERAQAVEAYLSAHPGSPFAGEATAYAGYLRQTARSLADKGTWATALADLMGNQMMTDLSYLETSAGKRYYTLGDINRKEVPRVGTTFEAVDPKNLAKRVPVFIVPPITLKTPLPVLAGHAVLARRLADELKQIDENNWETWGTDAIDRVMKATDIEPVVQAILLQDMIKTNKEVVGWALPGIYERAEAALARLDLPSIVWLDPDHPVSDTVKQAIQRAIARIPPGAQVKQAYAARRGAMYKALSLTVVGNGLLLRTDAGAWTIATPAPPADDAIALAIGPMPPTGPQSAPLVLLGRAKAGQFAIDATSLRDIPEGSLVFIVPPQSVLPGATPATRPSNE